MKISDLDYWELNYNIENGVSDIIARLHYPQKYIQLCLDGQLYNLEVIGVDDNRFIVELNGLCKNGLK